MGNKIKKKISYKEVEHFIGHDPQDWITDCMYRLMNKKISNIELLDAVVHLGIFLGVFYIMDYSLPVKKPLNYFKTPAEF